MRSGRYVLRGTCHTNFSDYSNLTPSFVQCVRLQRCCDFRVAQSLPAAITPAEFRMLKLPVAEFGGAVTEPVDESEVLLARNS